MRTLQHLLILLAITALSSGCCVMQHCAPTSCATPPACDGCGSSACGAPGGCLGLKCLGKLFRLSDYGCGGCGETYYHDWISDPPCADPCDCDGNWTGAPACSDCTGTLHGAIGFSVAASCCEAPSCGSPCDSACDPCAVSCCPSTSCCEHTGRLLYKTWMGVGNVIRGIHHGFLPACGSCNAFSFSGTCMTCSQSPISEASRRDARGAMNAILARSACRQKGSLFRRTRPPARRPFPPPRPAGHRVSRIL